MGVNDYIKVGARIKECRQIKGIKQKEIAAKLGIPISTYANYENDHREPPSETLQLIAELLGTTVTALIGLNPFVTPFFAVKDLLSSLGYEIEVYEEDAYIWIRDRKNNSTYEITLKNLDDLEKNITAYTKFQIQELISRSRKLSK